jgi:hypothetical protein
MHNRRRTDLQDGICGAWPKGHRDTERHISGDSRENDFLTKVFRVIPYGGFWVAAVCGSAAPGQGLRTRWYRPANWLPWESSQQALQQTESEDNESKRAWCMTQKVLGLRGQIDGKWVVD